MSAPNNEAAMSWAEIGRMLGISKKTAQKTGERALAKLRAALEAEGITKEVFLDYLRTKDRLDTLHYENLEAITTAGEPSRDEGDPKPWTKLRSK